MLQLWPDGGWLEILGPPLIESIANAKPFATQGHKSAACGQPQRKACYVCQEEGEHAARSWTLE